MNEELRNKLLGDLIQLVHELDQGKVPYVSSDINHVYVHFYDEDDIDIGNVALGTALHGLWNDVYLWSECSSEQNESGEPVGDLDMRDAVRLDLQTH